MQLRFDVAASPGLDLATKRRLERLAGSRMTGEGVLVIFAQRFRSQERNRDDARGRLLSMLAAAAEPPKPRVKTRPTLAAKRRRVDAKTKRGATKRLRGRPDD